MVVRTPTTSEGLIDMPKFTLVIAAALTSAALLAGGQALAGSTRFNTQSRVALNPQPLPPCATCGQVRQILPGERVTKNQPPPRLGYGGIASGISPDG